MDMLSKGFDFSALFSSPGLSILRDNEEDARLSKEHWLGFSHLPSADAFDLRPGDISRSQLRKAGMSIAASAPAFPCTPARTSVSPYAIGSTTKRRQNVEGLKEIVTYGILKTAKKASAATVKRRQRGRHAQGGTDTLETRQKKLVAEMDSIDQRLKDLVARATAVPTTMTESS